MGLPSLWDVHLPPTKEPRLMRCKHRWRETSRTFTPPRYELTKINAPETDVFERTINGFTTIELRCERCGDITHRQTPGNQTKSNANIP